jgi:hypothetical protein
MIYSGFPPQIAAKSTRRSRVNRSKFRSSRASGFISHKQSSAPVLVMRRVRAATRLPHAERRAPGVLVEGTPGALVRWLLSGQLGRWFHLLGVAAPDVDGPDPRTSLGRRDWFLGSTVGLISQLDANR